MYYQKRIAENERKLVGVTTHLYNLSRQRRNVPITDNVINNSIDLLAKRQADALGMQIGIESSNADKDSNGCHEEAHTSTAVLLGSSIPVKNAVRPIKLPEVKRLPPYTTWIFLDRLVMDVSSAWHVSLFSLLRLMYRYLFGGSGAEIKE